MKVCHEFSFLLKSSPGKGIGVFTTHPIDVGTYICRKTGDYRILPVKDIPKEFLKYCVFETEETCYAPTRFDNIGVLWFINHSFTPNCQPDGNGNIVAISPIEEGDEITINYQTLNEPESMRESYYCS